MSRVLPEHWAEVPFERAYTFTRKPRGVDHTKLAAIPFVPMEAVPIGSTYFRDFVLKNGAEIKSGTYFEPGDILLAKITPSFENGKQGIIEELPSPFGFGSTELIPIKAIEGASEKLYLFYYLLRHSVRTDLAGKMQGSTGRQRLTPQALRDLVLPLPPLPEQRAIAHVLTSIRRAIETRKREVALERERKAALMEYLFTCGIKGEATKQTDIGEIPASWTVIQLGEVILEGPQNGIYKPQEDYGTGTFILRITDFDVDGRFTRKPLQRVHLNPQEVEKYGLHKDDLVINRVNSLSHLGKTTIIPELPEVAVFESNMMRIRLKTEVALPSYVFRYLTTEAARQHLKAKAKRAVAQSSINQTDVKSLPVPLPSPGEQEEIIALMHACDAKINAQEREVDLHEELFRAMLEELMTGRLSALSLVEEAAEVPS